MYSVKHFVAFLENSRRKGELCGCFSVAWPFWLLKCGRNVSHVEVGMLSGFHGIRKEPLQPSHLQKPLLRRESDALDAMKVHFLPSPPTLGPFYKARERALGGALVAAL